MKKSILLILAILIVAGGVIGLYMFNKKVPTLDSVSADYEVTANALFDAFDQNEKAALEKYEGKVIQVTGEVARTKVDTAQLNIVLKAENSMMGGVNCSLRDTETKIPGKGTTITLKGRCQGFLMDVVINNCVIVQ